MNNGLKSLTAILAVTLLFGTGMIIADNVNDAYADNINLQWDYDNVPSTLNMYGGDSFTLVIFDTDEICAYWGETESTSTGPLTNTIRWATKSFENGNATLKATNIPVGTFLFPITAYADGAGILHSSITVIIEAPQYYVISFDSSGGSSIPSVEVNMGDSYGTLPTPSKSGYTFTGWYDGSTKVSASSKPTKDTTLVANWSANVIQYTAPNTANKLAVDISWSHNLSSTPGVSVTISGDNVSWLKSNGSVIFGTPTHAGTYTITLTLTAPNYLTTTESITLEIVPQLSLTNSPSNGAIAYVLL